MSNYEILSSQLSDNSKRILDYIQTLAQSQGFYGRLLRALIDQPEKAEAFLAQFHGCNSPVDFVLAIEC